MLRLTKEVYSSIKGLLWSIGWQSIKLVYAICAELVDIGINIYKLIKG